MPGAAPSFLNTTFLLWSTVFCSDGSTPACPVSTTPIAFSNPSRRARALPSHSGWCTDVSDPPLPPLSPPPRPTQPALLTNRPSPAPVIWSARRPSRLATHAIGSWGSSSVTNSSCRCNKSSRLRRGGRTEIHSVGFGTGHGVVAVATKQMGTGRASETLRRCTIPNTVSQYTDYKPVRAGGRGTVRPCTVQTR
ncbi:hypothetical protein K432DRAFT_92497 [Lepidopterella palustris CBS 459.81]|uniref:Secreted protein n=1 Tax=Lepidopterella palustris CBS 459.81 TaxID=1314670 RepID=A0A8E2JDF7_9PEZI|nr:hypothetical protein K432DRAFT_92497 [Lepidopterella palustris CBS 459.81]